MGLKILFCASVATPYPLNYNILQQKKFVVKMFNKIKILSMCKWHLCIHYYLIGSCFHAILKFIERIIKALYRNKLH
jgi:hypothetical protein